jgi:hypothetical protein
MKTKNQNQKRNGSELKSRPEQVSKMGSEGVNGYISQHETNRSLPAERVMMGLKRWMPIQHKLAKVVGKWIWIRFAEIPPKQIRTELFLLGFHWNAKRKVWQHPGGCFEVPAGEATAN